MLCVASLSNRMPKCNRKRRGINAKPQRCRAATEQGRQTETWRTEKRRENPFFCPPSSCLYVFLYALHLPANLLAACEQFQLLQRKGAETQGLPLQNAMG